MTRIKESVLPSGVSFSVRNFVGKDQDDLTKKVGKDESGAFNELMFNVLQSIGDRTKEKLTMADVTNLFENDRKFALVTARQHSLEYQEEFNFKFEWPLEEGKREKEMQEYTVTFDHDNFPVVPYIWMQTAIKKEAEKRKQEIQVSAFDFNEEEPEPYNPDGHLVPYPILFANYEAMVRECKEISLKFDDGREFKWEVLDGKTAAIWAPVIKKSFRINMMIEMRKVKMKFDTGKSIQFMDFETATADIRDLEMIRQNIRLVEGTVDTSLTIQHQTDRTRTNRVDLITLPVFFFPSQAL